jgi:hypothetical protein
MVVERFRNRDAVAIYRRFRERGRMMPEGLEYVGSWIETNYDRCFQLMRCDDPRLFDEWTAQWRDLMEFDIVPVSESKQVIEAIAHEL